MPSQAPDLLIHGLTEDPRAAVLFRLLAALEISDPGTASTRCGAMRCGRRPPRRFRIISVSSVARLTPRGDRLQARAGRCARVEAGALDLTCFERLAREGARRQRSSDRPMRRLCLREALVLVARPAFGQRDLRTLRAGRIARLEERRTAAH
jgi:hypothetical protein